MTKLLQLGERRSWSFEQGKGREEIQQIVFLVLVSQEIKQ